MHCAKPQNYYILFPIFKNWPTTTHIVEETKKSGKASLVTVFKLCKECFIRAIYARYFEVLQGHSRNFEICINAEGKFEYFFVNLCRFVIDTIVDTSPEGGVAKVEWSFFIF